MVRMVWASLMGQGHEEEISVMTASHNTSRMLNTNQTLCCQVRSGEGTNTLTYSLVCGMGLRTVASAFSSCWAWNLVLSAAFIWCLDWEMARVIALTNQRL